MDFMPHNYEPIDYGLLAASSLGILGDWGQTRTISKNNIREINPILGSHPKTSDVDKYFAASLLGNYLIGNNLPEKYRRLMWGGITGMQAHMLFRNNALGIGMDFKF